MQNKDQKRPPTLWDRFKTHAMGPMGLPSIGQELVYAVADIRQKLVEEATYGRPTTPPIGIHGVDHQAPRDGVQPEVGTSFTDKCRNVARSAPEQDRSLGHDRGVDL